MTRQRTEAAPVTKERMEAATRCARAINIAGVVCLLWALFYPRPHTACIVVSIAVPLLALLLTYIFRGLIRVDSRNESEYPNVALGLIMPGFGLIARGVGDFNILSYAGIWKYAALLSICMFVLLWMATDEFNIKKGRDIFSLIAFAFLMSLYSMGTLMLINCKFDRSEPQLFQTTIIEKSRTAGTKSTTYHLMLAPWGSRTEAENVTVTEDEWDAAKADSTVDVYLHEGLIGTPWFWVKVRE